MSPTLSPDSLAQRPALDRASLDGLLELVGEDDAFLRELFASFAAFYCEAIEGMREALAADDGDCVRQLAHSLKGSSGNLGALVLSDIARELQRASDESDLERAREWIEAADREFDRVMREARLLLPGFSGA